MDDKVRLRRIEGAIEAHPEQWLWDSSEMES